uniref:Immunoglobulin subtype domain-containing protein n=1 Tax=Biomphalaria glabrata TaxID=6526 RepID=A0A2C9KIP0_BIOGL
MRLFCVSFCILGLSFECECYRESIVVKVGENATIRGTFNHTFNGEPKLRWCKEGDYMTYSKCYPDLTCEDFSPKTSTTIRHLEQRTFEFEFVIQNVTEKDKGEWYLEYLGQIEDTKPLYICNISLLERNIESPIPASQKGPESSPYTEINIEGPTLAFQKGPESSPYIETYVSKSGNWTIISVVCAITFVCGVLIVVYCLPRKDDIKFTVIV